MPRGRAARREAAEADLQQDDQVDRITEAIHQAMRQPRQEREFKAPKFDGSDDVELFVTQFQEVADANGWGALSSLLHLREALQEGAKACGRGDSVDSIFTALRAKYGLTVREARARLNNRKDPKVSLQAHATEIERLTNIAYADLPEQYRANMALDTFSTTVGNTYLQRHLLAVAPDTLEAAVRAGNEFLQVQHVSQRFNSGTTIMNLEDSEEGTQESVKVAMADTKSATMDDVLAALKELTLSMTNRQPRTNNEASGQTQSLARRTATCWGCGAVGHIRRQCPNQGSNLTTRPKQSGNGYRPQ